MRSFGLKLVCLFALKLVCLFADLTLVRSLADLKLICSFSRLGDDLVQM